MLRLYGALRSRASRNYWLALELGLDFEHVPVIQASRFADPLAPDAPLNTASPAFRTVNPGGLIPVLDDGGLILTESLAINLHLARKHGAPLGPRDHAEDGLFGMWSFWAATEIEPHAIHIIVNRAIRPEGERDAAAVDRAIGALKTRLGSLERALDKGDGFIVGGRFTVADLNLAEIARYAQPAPELFTDFPAISRWLTACQSRPAHQRLAALRDAEPLPAEWRKAYRPSAPA